MKNCYLMTNSTRELRGSKRRRRNRRLSFSSPQRRLFSEQLEMRAMLNGDWHNPVEATDVNGDGLTTPIDALHVVNELNLNGPHPLDGSVTPHEEGLYYDTFQDGHVSPLDAVTVLNAIDGEGEEHDLVQLRVTATDSEGNEVSQVDVGQDFVLRVMVQDLTARADGGVFAAYLDITYEADLVSVNGDIEHGDSYGNAPDGDLATPGLIDEAGSIDGLNPLGVDELELFSIPMTADANGSVNFLPDPADLAIAHDILVFGETEEGLTNIPTDRVAYVPYTLQVGEAESIEAVDDSYDVMSGEVLIVNAQNGVLANDNNPFDDPLEAALVDNVEHGDLTLAADGSFSYTPDDTFVGTDGFTYQASAGENSSNVASVTLNVLAGNAAPVGTADEYAVDEDMTLTTTVSVLDNDTDADGDPLTASVVTEPSNGTLALESDGQFTYTPDADFNGTDTFEYVANDGTADSEPTLVTITVNNVNDAPVANGDAYTGESGSTLVVDVDQGVLNNDTDVDGDVLTASVISEPASGSLTLNEDGSFEYEPNVGFVGSDSFTYVANDGLVDSNTATVTIDIQGDTANQVALRLETADTTGAPIDSVVPGGEFLLQVFVQDVGTPPRDGVFAAYLDVVYDSDLVSLNGALDFSGEYTNLPSGNTSVDGLIDEVGAFASLTPLGDGEFLLVSAPMIADSVGMAEFTSNPADDSPAHDILLFGENEAVSTEFVQYGTAQLEIVGGEAPVAEDDAYELDEDTTLEVMAADGVLANDSDADGDELTAVLIEGAANGSVVLNSDGSFTYTPDMNFNGTDTFTYRANDGSQQSAIATVSLEVDPVDDPPVAADDEYQLDTIGDLVVSAADGVLANDTDVDGDEMTAVLVDDPENGAVTLNDDGSFSYSPAEGFVGVDTFTYRASANDAQSEVATVSIRVGDISPGSVSGFVYSDTDNDGVMDGGEARYGGVRIRLQGRDLLGNRVSEETVTASDGSYRFDEVLQGNYRVTEFQPLHLLDGKDRVNGGRLSLRNDRYQVEMQAGRDVTNLNFGERGLDPAFINNPMFFASRTDHALLAMTDGSGQLAWYCLDPNWDGVTDVDLQLSSDRSSATVSIVDGSGATDSRTVALDVNRNARLLTGSPTTGYMVRLNGNPEDFGLSVNDALDAEAVDQLFGG